MFCLPVFSTLNFTPLMFILVLIHSLFPFFFLLRLSMIFYTHLYINRNVCLIFIKRRNSIVLVVSDMHSKNHVDAHDLHCFTHQRTNMLWLETPSHTYVREYIILFNLKFSSFHHTFCYSLLGLTCMQLNIYVTRYNTSLQGLSSNCSALRWLNKINLIWHHLLS